MPRGCRGSYALVVLNPHHVTRLVPRVAPFERHVSLGSAIDGYTDQTLAPL